MGFPVLIKNRIFVDTDYITKGKFPMLVKDVYVQDGQF